MATTVLVTGGFGFIGAHVVRDLLEAGSRLVVIERAAEGNSADEVISAAQRSSLEHVSGDIPDAETLTMLLQEYEVDTVVHLASSLATVTETRERATVEEMISPHLAVLDACRRAHTRRVVWASSVGVFGKSRQYGFLPIPNDAPHLPLTLYGAAKSFLERMSAHYTTAYGLDTLGLRFPLVYGPARQRGGGQFTTRLVEAAALGRRYVVERADDKNSWMYVADAARSVTLAIRAKPTPSRALTVVGYTATTREVAAILTAWFPDADLVLRGGDVGMVARFDPTPALRQIGYEPSYTLRDGLLATANAARERAGLSLLAA